MAKWRKVSTSKQLAGYLRGEIQRGQWQGKMPGVIRLANDLGVAKASVEAAMRELEREGILHSHGKGRGRTIDPTRIGKVETGLRVVILPYERSDLGATDMIELLHELREAGHIAFVASKTMSKLKHQVGRIARLVADTEADAWVILAGSRNVLEWFAQNQIPAFAYAGRASKVPLPSIGPNKDFPLTSAIRRLYDLGHRRIVMLVREERRIPEPGHTERLFLEELKSLGVSIGSYNLPDWEGTIEGFQTALDSLFQFTPPTALIVDEEPFVVATLQFCLARGLRIPDDLSLLCTDPGTAFEWSQPSIAHIEWDHHPIVRRIVDWASNLSKGKEDKRKSHVNAKFIEGGTIGPAPKAS